MGAAESFFSPGGLLSRAHPAYEHRPGQDDMARAVERVLGEGGTLMVEAGTGTGKTLAYLVPALEQDRRVIVSTGTRNLQDQIFNQDLPPKPTRVQSGAPQCTASFGRGTRDPLRATARRGSRFLEH